ncbi:aminotransferase class 3 [Exophiala viscosa]|uniref:Aminotransferase class 3 n=1 Tax=Exophiala viscosa TaxID=2486360 RepID=A0AAN6IA18_9EURO|nr:aminotransferase class 3 [Exophiala viscosa]
MSSPGLFADEEHSYIASQVASALASFAAKNPKSAKAHGNATAHMPGGNTRTTLFSNPFPLAIKSGAGKTLTSVDGRTYIDFLGEYSAGLFGHSNSLIAETLITAIRNGWNFGGETLVEKELASKVTKRFSEGGLDLVRFTNSGTEANTLAIGTAIHWTGGRKKVLVFSNSYHGATMFFTMDLCRWVHFKSSSPRPAPLASNLPHDFVMAPYNNVAETKTIIEDLPNESLAAIVVEAVQGGSGCRPATFEFLSYLRETATKLGAVLIVDEVMTSRLGPSGALAAHGLKADLMTLGKWIGGGMSFGAFGGRRDIMDVYNPANGVNTLWHPGTFNNNVFSMSAGVVGLNIYDEQKVHEFNARGDRMKAGLTQLLFDTGIYSKEHAEHLKDIREIDSFETSTRVYTGNDDVVPLPKVLISGRGTMLNLRFTGSDAGLWHSLYHHFMLEHGIYMASRGYTPMSLEITDEDVDNFVDLVGKFMAIHLDELLRKK